MLSATLSAQTNVVTAAKRAEIESGAAFSNFGRVESLYSVHTVGYDYFPLLQYDLSGFAGQQVVGSGMFNIFLSDSWGGAGDYSTELMSLRPIAREWSESGVTFNGFFGANELGDPISQAWATFDGYPGSWTQFVISESTLQSWIDDPSANYGFALDNLGQINNTGLGWAATGHPDLVFSDESGPYAANITFTSTAVVTTPEPASFVLLGTGLLGVLGFAHRRRSA